MDDSVRKSTVFFCEIYKDDFNVFSLKAQSRLLTDFSKGQIYLSKAKIIIHKIANEFIARKDSRKEAI